MNGWQGKGNTGVKYRFQCPDSSFYKGPFLRLGPDLSLEVSKPHARFSAWKSADRVGVALAKEQGRLVRKSASRSGTFPSKQEMFPQSDSWG